MFNDLVADQYHRNRLRALKNGFHIVQINRHNTDRLQETICTVLCQELIANCSTAACDCERLRSSDSRSKRMRSVAQNGRAVRLKLKGV